MSAVVGREVECFGKNKSQIPDDLAVIEDPKGLAPPDCGMFRILSKHGDTRVVWNRLSLAEVRSAKDLFDDLVTKGMVPYRVGVNGQASAVVMDQFDPAAEEVIFMPIRMIAGG